MCVIQGLVDWVSWLCIKFSGWRFCCESSRHSCNGRVRTTYISTSRPNQQEWPCCMCDTRKLPLQRLPSMILEIVNSSWCYQEQPGTDSVLVGNAMSYIIISH
eukprot:scaffold22736_cov111-Cylindrotheca_fusiformis.AAC.9